MLVLFLGATSATTTISDSVGNCHAPAVVKRGTQLVFARHQSNQPIRQLEWVLVKPVMVMEKSDTTRETDLKQQQPDARGEC